MGPSSLSLHRILAWTLCVVLALSHVKALVNNQTTTTIMPQHSTTTERMTTVPTPPSPCDSVECRHGGYCQEFTRHNATCFCRPGWGGKLCETPSCTTKREPPNRFRRELEPNPFGGEMESYCVNGGTCLIGGATSLPTCVCAPGYSGIRCLARLTFLTRVYPVVGPQSGGTDISFYGYNLDARGYQRVQLGKLVCPVKFVNATLIVCSTLPVMPNLLRTPLNMSVQFSDGSNLSQTLRANFTYMGDPTILSLEPLYTISSGGVMMNVTGTDLDIIGKSTLQVTVVYNEQPIRVFESLCTVTSAKKMQCPTPKLEIFNADGEFDINAIPPHPTEYPPYFGGPSRRRRRRSLLPETVKVGRSQVVQTSDEQEAEGRLRSIKLLHHQRRRRDTQTPSANTPNTKVAEYKINNHTLEFYIGFRLDGVPTYRNLTEALPQYAHLTVYTDPLIVRWDEEQEVRVGRTVLEVEGERLTVGIQRSDYRMLIGQSECTDLDVFNNKLICTAPEEMPEAHPLDTTSGKFTVMVHIGVLKEPVNIGAVKYRISFWDSKVNMWAVIGACIIGGILLTVGISIYIARTAK